MSNIDDARAVADKLRKEKEEREATESASRELAVSELKALQKDENLAQMYKDSSEIGAQNLSGELPLLKIHQTGKSSKNTLADGSEPLDGYFFYRPTGEQFKELTVHILTISAGFRAPGIEGQGETRDVFNQIMGGVILDGTEYKPFLMYLTGLKLSPMWDFGKEAKKYTKAKPIPIPLFALSVKLTTEKVENAFGKSWICHFDIVREVDLSPKLVMDPGEFQFLKDNVGIIEGTIEQVIAAKTKKGLAVTPLKEEEDPNNIPF